jgi:hypothetical protein
MARPKEHGDGDGSSGARSRPTRGAGSIGGGHGSASDHSNLGRPKLGRKPAGRTRPVADEQRPTEPLDAEGQAAKEYVDGIAGNPLSVEGKSAQELADQFTAAGYSSYTEQTFKRGTSGKAVQVRVHFHPAITNIEVHPGGGRHTPEGSPYWKISTSTNGKTWVVPGDFHGAERLSGQVVRYDE